MTRAQRFFPWLVTTLVALYVVSVFIPDKAESEFDFASFAKIPVSADGRVKPLDSVARNALLVISGRQTVRVGDERLLSIRWLAATCTGCSIHSGIAGHWGCS